MRGMAWFGGRAAITVACTAWAHLASAQAPGTPPQAAEVFSADVVVEDTIVDAQGAVVETRPATRYRLSRRRVEGGIETELAYPKGRLFEKGPLVDPRGGSRIVFGPAGTGTRIYDAAGALVTAIDAPPPPSAARDDATLVFADRDLRQRQAALQRTNGRAQGRLGRRDRYLSHDGDATTETLVEPGTMLPVEINVVRGGALVERSMLDYARMPGGRWYLARTRSEAAMPDGSGRRFVSTRTHLNVTATEGR